jgi:hypothetical protein
LRVDPGVAPAISRAPRRVEEPEHHLAGEGGEIAEPSPKASPHSPACSRKEGSFGLGRRRGSVLVDEPEEAVDVRLLPVIFSAAPRFFSSSRRRNSTAAAAVEVVDA